MRRFAQEAGAEANLEPATHLLLLNQFTPEQCRGLFPKKPTKQMQTEISDLLAQLRAAVSAEDKARLSKEFEAKYAACMARNKHDSTGLRIDVQIIDHQTGQELWVDTTCVHPTCKSRLDAEHQDTMDRLAARQGAAAKPCNSHAAIAQTTKKRADHAPLLAIATKQHLDGRRAMKPTFLAAVGTTLGELGPEAIRLQEALTLMYKTRVELEGPRPDGQTAAVLSADFRSRFRFAMLCGIAQGQALMLTTAGLPSSSCAKHAFN